MSKSSNDEQIVRAIQVAEIIAMQREGLPLSPDEDLILRNWLNDGNEQIHLELNTPAKVNGLIKELDKFRDQERIGTILASTHAPAINMWHRQYWLRYAALLLLVIGAAIIGYFILQPAHNTDVYANRIIPASARASLTLSDGTSLDLQKMTVGDFYKDGEVIITKVAGDRIAYQQPASSSSGSRNYLVTPRGAAFSIQLADGSRAWLNAESSITYYLAFKENRQVRISGEVYFEVAPHANTPFIVTFENGWQAEVLGTRFNVRNYSSQNQISVTLLEGSLQVNHPGKSLKPALLKAGQTASLLSDTSFSVSSADTVNVMAWRDGFFNFEENSFEESMREISRWYDVDIVYENQIPNVALSGQIDRQMKFTDLLRFLEKAGINLRMEGERRLVISTR